ncbi:FecR family protein [Rhodohalobacter sp. 8-1]|uniref:FecR family protein n=1 Tax=Rhodohalobacter sp. 8-1 TaxID=3131972 RepID=UPI0030ED7F72
MSRKLAEKFFNNQTTPAESEVVLEWFETSEGKQVLQEWIEAGRELMDRKDLRNAIPELDSDKLYISIQEEIKKKRKRYTLRRIDWLSYVVKAAAAVLVILTAALFTISYEGYKVEQITVQEPVIFQTNEEQHREITLNDGTIVRLNKNSEIILSVDFNKEKREIRLEGEAYFDVAHSSDKPFIINTGNSSIEVLGTSFNVRSDSGKENVQIAVVEGRVSFSSLKGDKPEKSSVILSKGQFGYLDVKENSIVVDKVPINNYLAWKSGRFHFNELTLQQVCTQLYRLYNLNCSFENQEIRNLRLTANFSNESLKKTLSVIALSLGIEFKKNEERVTWFKERQ